MAESNSELAEQLYERLDMLMEANVDAIGVAAGQSQYSSSPSDEVIEIGNAEIVRTGDKSLLLTIRTMPDDPADATEYSHTHVLLNARKKVQTATICAGGREFGISGRTRINGLLSLMHRSLETELESDPTIQS